MQKNKAVIIVIILILGILAGYFLHRPLNPDDQASAANANAKAMQKANSKAKANANPHSALVPCPPKVGDPYGIFTISPTNPPAQTVSYPTSQFTVMEFEAEAYDCAVWIDTIAGSAQYIGNSVPAGTPPLVWNFRLYDVTAGYPGFLIATAPAPTRCNDGANNDYDLFNLIDFPADPECTSAEDDDEESLLSASNLGAYTFRPNGPYVGYPLNPGPSNKRKFAIRADVINPPFVPWEPGVLFTMSVSVEAKDFLCPQYMTCPYIFMETPNPIVSNVISFQ